MSTLYVDRKDIELRQEGKHLCLYENGERSGTVPLHLIGRIVIHGRATLSTAVLGLLADEGIGLVILTGRQSRASTVIHSQRHGDTWRRIAQYRWYSEETERLRWASRLVALKLLSQIRFLKRARQGRPDLRTPLSLGIGQLERARESLLGTDLAELTISRLNGVEGSAAAQYFSALGHLFAPSLNFTGRNRRPPRDPVNAALSLGYTLLHFEAVNVCRMAGLDPGVGFYHEPAYNRESLAADLIEPLRAKVDAWVWRLFADRVLRIEAFTTEQGACRMNKSARQCFYANYEIFARPLRRLMSRYARQIATRLTEAQV